MSLHPTTIRLHTKHWLNDDPELLDEDYMAKRAGGKATAFIQQYIAGECSHVVVAYDTGTLVGLFRCDYSPAHDTLEAHGTFVYEEYRKAGLGVLLWSYAIDRLRPESISVQTVSLGGGRLVKAVRRKYRGIRISRY